MEIKRTGLWIGRQAARMCLMVLLVSILAFGLLAASPIDPLQTNVGQTALHESGTDRKTQKLLGNGSSAGGAVSELAERLPSWKHGNLASVPETGGGSHR